MHIRTTIVAAVASLSVTGTGLGQVWTPSELTATDGASDDYFGYVVAISGDTCVIGANRTNSYTGSAYVFTNTGGTWSQVAELTATDGEVGDNFGSSVAIDGSTCVIGAMGTNSFTGSAYVFTNTGGTWSQVAALTATDGEAGDFFGSSVAIDGNTCVIGAENTSTDSAYVFTNTGGTWSQVAELSRTGGEAGDNFGVSVAIDGDTCVIGANGTDSNTGSAYVFEYVDTLNEWIQWGPALTATGGASYDQFGQSVAIDGDTCVIGAYGTNSATGSAYVFTDTGGTWSQVQKLTATGGASGDYFGQSVAIDGNTCVIGADGTNSSTGSAYVFADIGGSWSQVAELTPAGGASGDYFGIGVAIDGDTCVIGAYGTNSDAGSAYVYGGSISATGACCVSSGCTVITESACTDLGGTWTEGGACDDCPDACAGDTNGDGVIDIFDLLNMLSNWGLCP